MNHAKKRVCAAAVLLCAAAAAAVLSYRAGYQAGGRSVTFYATVSEAGGSRLLATGSEDNDVNHRGAFDLRISNGTALCARDGSGIPAQELEAGDLIAVTYTGIVLESNPAVIPQVLEIRRLNR